VSSRTYLSIGDVLTLLRQEFPDVTISKIRFLESQGLVDPERTPSGYRKFYEQDVERLRWVLRQQREHFLPLKVIKGRLEEGAEGDDFDDFDELDELDGTEALDQADPLGQADSLDRGGPLHAVGSVPAPVGKTAEETMAETAATAEDTRRQRPEPVLVGQGATLGTTASGRSHAGPALPGFETQSPAPAPVGGVDLAAATFVAGDETEKPSAALPSSGRRSATSRPAASKAGGNKAAAAAKAPTVPAASGGPGGPGGPGVDPAGAEIPVSTVSGSSMTIEELAAATGLTVGDIQQLVSFGLVTGRPVGGVTYYDDEALTIARTAAGFARFGVEARHLRFYKHAAEREAGFIEQIVLPLLKQRNPEARQKAQDNVAELSRLGQSLRTVLLRNALRDQLGG
jgi:DNA-binding transcriptional MerR regulator